MNDIMLAVNVVFPLMFMMMLGYLVKKVNLVDEHALNVMNKLTFRVFLSSLIFLNIYKLDIEKALSKENLKLIIMLYVLLITIFLISILILPKFVADKKKCSVIIQGLVRGNSLLYGIPIAASLYGEDNIGLVVLLSSCIIPLFNILGVIALETFRGEKVNIKKVILGIAKNPSIIASVLGFLFLVSGINLPNLIISPLESISKVTIPLAFIVLGGTFNFKVFTNNMKYLTSIVIGKLVAIPAVTFFTAYRLGFRNEIMVSFLAIMASPVPIASFTMAKEMDADAELAGQIVIATSAVSILTIFVWIYLLKRVDLI